MARLKIAARAVALGALLASAAAAQARPTIITNPDWLRKPSADDMARNYPQVPMMLNLAGRVVMHCSVAVSGRLEDCAIPEEAPQGLGFGAAALALGRGFLMRPQTRDGAPVAGGQVNIPIVFQLPTAPPPEPPPPGAKSPATLALAQKAVAAAKAMDGASQTYEQAAAAFDQDRWPDVSPENSATIAKALRASYPVRLQEVADDQARVYASLFTAAQLIQLEAFFRSPAAAVLYGQTDEARANAAALNAEGLRRQGIISRTIFCASHSCLPDQPLASDADAPQWLHTPTRAQISQSRPDISRGFNLPGSARLTCAVMAQGSLSGCQVAGETPTGLGFGGAALTLAGYYSLDLTAPKAAAVGQPVTFSVHFDAPDADEASAYAPPAARSPASLAMARELLAAMNPEIASPTALLRQRAAAQPPAKGVTRADQTAVFDIMDQTYRQVRRELMDLRASWVTTQLTDADLSAALQVWHGPLGPAWRTHNQALTMAAQKARSDINVRVWGDVGKTFCAEHACYTPPPQPVVAAGSASSTRSP